MFEYRWNTSSFDINSLYYFLGESFVASSHIDEANTGVTKEQPAVEEVFSCKAEISGLEDDRKLSKVFVDDDLRVSLSLAPIDTENNDVTFTCLTNEDKILEVGDYERIVSSIISVEGSFPPVLNVPGLLTILCSVQFLDLDENTEIILTYEDASTKSWQILQSVGLEKQDYGNSFSIRFLFYVRISWTWIYLRRMSLPIWSFAFTL